MGLFDSSKYRVTPLVDKIKGNQQIFDLLLESVVSTRKLPSLICPPNDSAYFYGVNEKQLKPTQHHLCELVKYMAKKGLGGLETSNPNRGCLYGQNGEEMQAETIEKALLLIDDVYDKDSLPRAWYIFEGMTNPDIYIEGDDYIIVCEGKWTESHITMKTSHLKDEAEQRSQMVRHIQAALNSSQKPVYAFYIVDEECGYLEDLTEEAFVSQIEKETIEIVEKAEVIDAFYGYTTWQKLSSLIPNLTFLSKDDIKKLHS